MKTKMMTVAASVLAAGALLVTGCNNSSRSAQTQPSAPVISGNKAPTAIANDPRMSPQARAAISATAGKTATTP